MVSQGKYFCFTWFTVEYSQHVDKKSLKVNVEPFTGKEQSSILGRRKNIPVDYVTANKVGQA